MRFQLGAHDRGQTVCPGCRSRYAASMLLREEWHLSHFNSWSCFGKEESRPCLTKKKSCCSQPSWSFSQPISSRCCSLVCRLLLHWRPTKQKGCTGGLNSAVVVGTGLAEQAHRDTHHAAGTLESLFEPLLCGACFFFFFSFPAVSSVWMVEHKGYFEGAHRWLWFGQSWQTACQLLLI